MDWVPIVLITFKVLVLAIGMFFAIKWHYDQDKSSNPVKPLKLFGEFSFYILIVVIVFALLYALFHYLRLLPAGLIFY